MYIKRESPKLAQSGHADMSALCRLSGRVGVWRGGCRLTISVAATFVWRCLSRSAVGPFPHSAHRTGQADLPHPALGQDLTPLCDVRRHLRILNPFWSL